MRQFYESPLNIERERAIAEAVAAQWESPAHKLKVASAVDYAFVRNARVVGFAECKAREYTMAKMQSWGGVMLSVHKWERMLALHKCTNLPVLFIVQDADGVIWWHHPTDFGHDGVMMGGRTDRGDSQDIEPVILLGSERFRTLL